MLKNRVLHQGRSMSSYTSISSHKLSRRIERPTQLSAPGGRSRQRSDRKKYRRKGQANGIDVTALRSHMLLEDPRLFLMHFCANDGAIKLAKRIRATLDKTASAKN